MKARPRSSAGGSGLLSLFESRAGTLLAGALIALAACVVLVLALQLLPNGYVKFAVAGTEIKDPDGTLVRIPQGAVAKGSSIKISSTSQQAFASTKLAQSLPANLEVKSPFYSLSVQGEMPKEAEIDIPIPNDADPLPTLDLWAQYGNNWFKIPFVLNEVDQQLESKLNFVPDGVVVVQTKPQAPLIGAMLTGQSAPPGEANALLTEMDPGGLHLADEGAVAGDVVNVLETSASSPYSILPTVTNTDENGVRIDLTENMLMDPAQRTAHIRTLVDLAVQKLYAGYNLQYEGLTTQDQDAFTGFVKELAKELHAQQKQLSVTLPAPKPVAENEFDTAGYDWALIGRYADEVKVPLLPDTRAYDGDNPPQEQYLLWAADQIDRNKLQVTFSVMGRDEAADKYVPVSLSNALKLLGPISAPAQAAPGSQVTLDLPKLRDAGGIQHHEASGMYYFNYKDDKGTAHTVWLEDADSLAKKTAMLLKFNLHGIALQDVDGKTAADPRIWTVLDQYRQLQPSAMDTKLTVVWVVDDQVVGKTTANDPKITWTVPNVAGPHNIDVALSIDEGATYGPSGGQVALNITQPTPTPTPQPTQAPTQAAPAKPTKAPVAVATRAPAPAGGPPPAAVGVNRFGYGIQLNWTNSDHGSEMSQVKDGLHFGWVKIQVRWCDIENPRGNYNSGGIDDLVAAAAAKGVKVLFSIVCAPGWSRADGGAGGSGPPDNMQDAADFMGTLAGKYCGGAGGAIEVWNEHNLLTEWHGKPLSAAMYMDMLKRSYGAIKAKCPSMIVVSGAPTPTGWNDGVVAIDDGIFLEQLYQNGLKQYSDAIGAHPSGFNVPALCNDLDPACTRPGASYQAPWTNRHHSWGFLATMTTYRNIMNKYGDQNKQIWATEFGWPVGTGGTCGSGPCHPAGADNSPNDLATWFPQAFQWAKKQGWVGVMFVWNLDFYGGEVGAFHIQGQPAFDALAGCRANGSCPD